MFEPLSAEKNLQFVVASAPDVPAGPVASFEVAQLVKVTQADLDGTTSSRYGLAVEVTPTTTAVAWLEGPSGPIDNAQVSAV